MAEICKSRTIRPSSRKETSISYRINVDKVSSDDILIVTIDHESQPLKKVYRFSGKQLQGRNTIHFRYKDNTIIWSPISPDL